jgi:hypothetical protein
MIRHRSRGVDLFRIYIDLGSFHPRWSERQPVKSIWVASGNYRKRSVLLFVAVLLSSFLFAPRAASKISTDFDPHIDFSQLKTFAFVGSVEQLVRLQLNPEQLNNRIHRAATRELTAKGLREVEPKECNPSNRDLPGTSWFRRILSWRQWCRSWRQPPDRMDRSHRSHARLVRACDTRKGARDFQG